MYPLPHSVPPTLQQATSDPRLCWRLLDTHRQVWVSLLWGNCSFLLGPGAHKVLFVPSKSVFPQPCVCSGGSMVGLVVSSSKRAYTTPRSTAPRALASAAVKCWPIRPQERLKHSSGSVSVGPLGSRAMEPQYLKPIGPRASAPQSESWLTETREKPMQQQRPSTAINFFFFFF